MIRLPLILVALAALMAPGRASADDAELTRLFPRVAELSGTGGLCRLDVPPAVLSEAQADFSDVRIIGVEGREVPFLIDRAQVRWPSDGPPAIRTLVPLDVSRDRDDLHSTEEVRIRLPIDTLPPGATWNLVVDSATPNFVRHYVLMDASGTAIDEGSVFRLLSPHRASLGIQLPRGEPGTEYRVRFDGERSFLEPSFRIAATEMSGRASRLETPLTLADLRVEDGTTTIELERPPGVVPSRLRFTTTSSFFSRVVTVFDLQEGRAPRHIGAEEIFRAREAGAELLTVRVSRSAGARLRVVIEDGDSPSLAGLHIVSHTLQPSLFYECEAGQKLYVGGGRAGHPRYDTQRFGGTMLGEAIARGSYSEATVGNAADNPAFDDGPALAYLMRAGRVVDRSQFTTSLPVFVQGAREGVSRVEPSVGLLARAASDLRDVRIVDAEGQQWPYVRAPEDAEVEVRMTAERAPDGDSSSTYALHTPEGDVELRTLRITTTSNFVRRAYELRTPTEEGGFRTLAQGELNRSPDGPDVMELSITAHRGDMELIVQDGNDAPLDIEVHGVIEAPVFYLIAPEGSYELLAGAEVPAPSYEVAAALPLILATAVGRARVGEPGDNPAYAPPPVPARFQTEEIVVWVALLLGVLILGFFTWRAAREPDVAPATASGAPSTGDETDVDGAGKRPEGDAADPGDDPPA